MKRQFLTAVLVLTILNVSLNGQELLPKMNSNEKWGYVDEKGKMVIFYKFEEANYFYEELAAVMLNGKWGYIDKTGKEIISFTFQYADSFSEELARVRHNDKWGFVDKTGTKIIPFKYYTASSFSEGLSSVNLNGKCGYIDKNDKLVIPFMYDFAGCFSSGLATVKLNGKWGCIDKTGNIVVPIQYNSHNEAKVNIKGETSESFATKAKVEREKKLEYLRSELKEREKEEERIAAIQAEVETKEAEGVAVAKAKAEKEEIERVAALKAKTEKEEAERLATVKKQSIQTTQNNTKNFTTLTDVSKNIPVTNARNDKTFAIIIANENYQERGVSQVAFAINDGTVFREYCIKTLGIPERNIKYRTDATLNNIRSEIRWITQLANQRPGEINIIFFYAGHGTNDEVTQSAYLLPVDGVPLDIETAYKLDDLYQKLGNLPTKSVTIFLDACYSGTGRDDRMLAETRGVKIKARQGVPVGNTVVFSAAQGDETAHPFDAMKHGMFTYFLLKKLQDTKGDVTFGELGDYISSQVAWESILEKSKSQTPMVTPSRAIESDWKTWKLK